tara:strand:+ start:4297 stop:4449 length:153 start_codon:yes stop_codon:yes gene_type:complete
MNKVNAFENEIFDHYRQKAKDINKAIELLKEHNYIIVDLEGQIIRKETKE